MTLKGYADQAKTADGVVNYATIGPVRDGQYGLDVLAHMFHQLIGTDAVEDGTTTRIIVATAHSARKGDLISITSGALSTLEARVQAVATNSITLAEALPSVPATGVTFGILRPKAPLASSSGGLSLGLTQGAGNVDSTTLRVVVATDQTAYYVKEYGLAYADSARRDYSSGNVNTSSWTQLIAATAADINQLYIFDSSGQTMELGTGAAASEARKLIIPPGGFAGPVKLRIASGTRVAVRAISATASAGEINITGMG